MNKIKVSNSNANNMSKDSMNSNNKEEIWIKKTEWISTTFTTNLTITTIFTTTAKSITTNNSWKWTTF